MFCERCRKYRSLWRGRPPAFCDVCGQPVTLPDRAQLEADRARLGYLLDELAGWTRGELIHPVLRERLARPYEVELSAVVHCIDGPAPVVEGGLPGGINRPQPPQCHAHSWVSSQFCPDCGVDIAAWRR